MIERVAIAVLAFLVLFFGGALLLPRTVQVERSIEIDRPVVTVFTVLNRFDAFPAWSPWSVRDPEVSYRTSGPAAGPGARLEWFGDPRLVGTGQMEIVESRPHTLIRHELEIDGRRSAAGRYVIERKAGGARVAWRFDFDLVAGQGLYAGLMSRYFGLLLERWIGPDFEQGLKGLKRYVESLPPDDFSGLDVSIERVEPVDVLKVSIDGGDGLSERMARAYHDIAAYMAEQGIERSGGPISLHRQTGDGADRYEAAIPAPPAPGLGNDVVAWGQTPAGPVAKAVHRGGYAGIDATYRKLAAWMAANGLERGAVSWEQYLSDPATTPASERVTHIYVAMEPAE